MNLFYLTIKQINKYPWSFLGSPVIKNPCCNAGDTSSTPFWEDPQSLSYGTNI